MSPPPAPRGGGPRPRVSLFVHDLAGNPIVRAAPLAQALAADFEVELLGLLLSGPAVYAPYRSRFPVHALPARRTLPHVLAAAPHLARLARGDVLLACKPLLTTLLPAWLAARGGRRPLLLDVEDDEWAARSVDDPGPGWRGVARRLADTHRWHARLAHPLVARAQAVTVSSRALQARYGGTLLRHGPDDAWFDPARPELRDRARLRRRFGLPAQAPVALFAGIPRPHKGWEVLLQALQQPAAANWRLAGAGNPDHPGFVRAAERLGPRFHALGLLTNREMPALLACVDAVPVPQLPTAYAAAQLPAKALEAMAMQVPVLATPVGDLPEVLGAGERGWLVPPGDATALAGALADLVARPAEAARRARAARGWYLAEAGPEALRSRLLPLIWNSLDRR